jgi:mercuric ion transport protein
MKLNGNGPIVGGVLAAVGASVCCVLPLVLVSLGIGGAWMSMLTGLEPARPVFIALTLGFFGLGYYRLYRRPAACAPGQACAVPKVMHRQRALFWAAALVVLALIAIPWLAPSFA